MSVRRRVVRARQVSAVRREVIDWLDPGRIAFGEVTILAGTQGLGKSTFLCQLAARVTTGEFDGSPRAVLMAGTEDNVSTTLKPRLEAAGANLELVRTLDVSNGPGTEELEDVLEVPGDLESLDATIAETGAALLTFDPLLSHLGNEVNSFKDQEVRKALGRLGAIARQRRVAVVTTFHLNKRDSADVFQRITASGAFTQYARSVFLFGRDPEDPAGERGDRRLLSHEKSNLGPLQPTQVYEIRPIVLPARPETREPEVTTLRLELRGESQRVARDLLGATLDESRIDRIEEAEEFLRDELADGPVLAADIKRAAKDASIKEITLKRAKLKLGVKHCRRGHRGPYEWYLLQPQSLLDQAPSADVDPPSGDPPNETAQPSGIDASQDPLVDQAQSMIHQDDGGLSETERALLLEADEFARNGGRWV